MKKTKKRLERLAAKVQLPRRKQQTTTASRRWQEQPKCRLLSLPAELRNTIFELALSNPPKEWISLNRLQIPNLLATCRQILTEALSIFLASNNFTCTITVSENNILQRPIINSSTTAWMTKARELGVQVGPMQRVAFTVYDGRTILAGHDVQLFIMMLQPRKQSRAGERRFEFNFKLDKADAPEDIKEKMGKYLAKCEKEGKMQLEFEQVRELAERLSEAYFPRLHMFVLRCLPFSRRFLVESTKVDAWSPPKEDGEGA